MNDTERYLKGATRGLWGKEKKALRTELQGHIRIRTTELMTAGLNQQEAERQTLRELGAPQEVSRGMAGVYAFQTAVKGTLLTSLLACAALLSVQQVQAQVQGVFGNTGNNGSRAYINLAQLKQELARTGGNITLKEEQGYMGILKFGAEPLKTYKMPTWPGAIYRNDGQDYLDARILMAALHDTGAPLEISGWKNPTIKAGATSITVETDDWRVINELYSTSLWFTARTLSKDMPWHVLEPNGSTEQVTIQNANLKAGHIYALVLPLFTDWYAQDASGKRLASGSLNLAVNAVQADADGKATFRIYPTTQPFKVVKDEQQFLSMTRPYLHNYAYWSEETPAPALLLELTGKFDKNAYKVLPPGSWK